MLKLVMGEVFAGRYELVDLLGTGGAGDVWRVWDWRDRSYQAGKVLRQSDSASLMRFVRETGWRFDHPHIVAPTGWAGEDDRVIFAMPIVHGGSLAELIKSYGPLPEDWVLPALGQLLEALAVVHDAGLVHRDIKPANLLLQPGTQPDVVLSDFGTAAPQGEPRLTRLTQVVGTPGYMSLEAFAGADPEPRQDLYSAAVVAVEALTGKRPSAGAVARGGVAVPSQYLGTPLGDFLGHLLAPAPQRTPSAHAALEELAGIDPAPNDGEPVIVTEKIPPLPHGWTDAGPLPRPQASSQPGIAMTDGGAHHDPSAIAPAGAPQTQPPEKTTHHRPAKTGHPKIALTIGIIAVLAGIVLVVLGIMMLG